MRLLASHTIQHADGPRFLRLYHGDLAAIPPHEAVDLLIVSAFPNDYLPTRTSLIGALHRKGISVAALADDMEADLRAISGCWVSRDLSAAHPGAGFRRLCCFEPLTRGTPAEVVGDIFRAIVPFALGEPPIRSIAMPVLAAGDQANDSEAMLRALFRASTEWLAHGLPLETIKIVVYGEDDAARLLDVLAALSRAVGLRGGPTYRGEPAWAAEAVAKAFGSHIAGSQSRGKVPAAADPVGPPALAPYDFFISYSRTDSAEVDVLVETIRTLSPEVRVFLDRTEIDPGEVWQTELDEALEECRKMIAVYSPSYFQSKFCMEEFNMARLRHRDSDGNFIIPIYLRSTELKLYPRSLNYVDCREGDLERVRSVCGTLVAALQAA